MKMKMLLVLCGAVAVILAGAPGCASDSMDRNKYDYVVVSPTASNKEQQINELAGQGWQLVDTDPMKGYLFRRPKPPAQTKP